MKTLQQALNKVGNYGLREDGIFGLKTEVALKDYQKKYGLTPDGIAGAKTWSKLGYSTSEVAKPRRIEEIILHCTATKMALITQAIQSTLHTRPGSFRLYVDPKTER